MILSRRRLLHLTASAAALPVRVILGANDPLRWYRFGGDFLPSPPLARGLGICAGVVLAWSR